ncbi:MAG: hypothetical protein EA417_15375 [Gammaproteobacteria bacterium]|nr:MAG: hypothetical protein EA417_15375 [Gammaproteobacteria bacterium]
MHIVARYPTRSEAEERAAFLRAHGIVPHVTNTSSLLRAIGLRRDRSQAALWVMIDTQFDDAAALLADPDHEVHEALSPEALAELEAEGAKRAQQLLFKGMMLLAGSLIALFVVLAWAGVL